MGHLNKIYLIVLSDVYDMFICLAHVSEILRGV